MTTPAQPDHAPRHARKRAAPAAAARNKQAAGAAKGARTAGAAKAASPQGAAVYAGEKGAQAARTAGRTVMQARLPGDRAYQPVLLAEFLAAAVIIVLPPIVTGGSDTAKAKGGISPYDTGDLRQLVAVGGVYFVLALASSGNSGRLSAWLGGLILIAIAMGKLANGGVSAVFNFAKPGQGVAAKVHDPFAQGDTGQ